MKCPPPSYLLSKASSGTSGLGVTGSPDQALLMDRQLASRPPNVFDPFALIGALNHLEDIARRVAHADVMVYCRPFKLQKPPSQSKIGDLVTHILRNDIQKEVAKTVAKM